MRIGKRIYYENTTGNVIVEIVERQGSVVPTTIEQDINTYKALSERNRDSFDYIELEYGQYAQDFAESYGFRINPETKQLEFSYPDPNEPEAPPVFQKPLSEQILELRIKQFETNQVLAENSAAQQDLLELLTDMGVI